MSDSKEKPINSTKRLEQFKKASKKWRESQPREELREYWREKQRECRAKKK